MADQPNLLVIFCDQLKRQALGCYGDPNVSTPNIDRLASQGTRFTQASSTYPICVPFRFSMMTGEYAHTRFVPAIEWRLSPTERCIAHEFNEAGYDTLYVGKWHLYGGHGLLPHHTEVKANRTAVPRAYQGGWKKWLGFDVANNPFNTHYFEDDDPTPIKLPGYQTDGLFDLTMKQLSDRAPGADPFMCVLSVEPPHFPLDAPPEYEARWQDRDMILRENFLKEAHRPSPGKKMTDENREGALKNLRQYYAMIENLDWNVGRMLDFLDRENLAKDTIIVFLSDHGQMDGSHCEGSTKKMHPYEESIGIPFIVYDPQLSVEQGTEISTPMATEDIYPSLLGLCGLTARDEKPGMDVSPLVRGEQESLPRDGVLLEFVHDLRPGSVYHEQYWRGYRGERYKYTVLGDGRSGGKPWQFFDLEQDPYELNNLVDDPTHQALVRIWHQKLRDEIIRTGDHYVLAPAFESEGVNLWE